MVWGGTKVEGVLNSSYIIKLCLGYVNYGSVLVFNKSVVDAEEVFQQAQIKSWLWLKHKGNKFTYSLSDWVLNPMICISSYK